MKTLCIPKWLTYGILLLAAFLFVFLFSCTTSPFYENYPFWFHGDSGIFQEMGVCLLQGGTPYLDLFDHKGPILWFIQALGIWISPRWGLLALQALALSCSMMMWYRSIQLLVGKQIPSILITITGLVFLLAFYQRGNLCEEWCLPFISLPIYLYIKRWKQSVGTHEQNFQWPFCSPATIASPQASKAPLELQILPAYQHSDAFIIGLCVGIIAMIRLNNTAPIVGFALWHFIGCFRNKDYRRLWTDIALIVIGMAIIFITCSVFYLIKASWKGVYEMIYGTIIFNFAYFENGTGDLSLFTKVQHYIPPVFVFFITIICLIHNKSTKNISVPITLSYIISLLAIGGMGFIHYMMIFIPLIILSIGLIIHTSTNWTYIILGLAIIHSLFLGYDAVDHLLFRLRGKQANTELNDGFHTFISSIPPQEQKSIYNAGLNHMGAGLFADEKLYQCNRIIYNGHTESSTHLQEYEKTHRIKDLQPIWILTQSHRPKATDDYMATHYALADSIPGGEFDPIWCWKLDH